VTPSTRERRSDEKCEQRRGVASVRDLSVEFHQAGESQTAVEGISFDIKRGETVALVGESGSGKSVSALSVLRLLPYPAASHPSGQILFKGQDLLSAPEPEIAEVRGNDITMIFQEPMTSLNPLQTVEKQISAKSCTCTSRSGPMKPGTRFWTCSTRSASASPGNGLPPIRTSFRAVSGSG
jgi:ABC-type microcin C transport system duplicated ATPase subunit YejF